MKIRIGVLITLASLGIESLSQNARAENEPIRNPAVEAVVVKAQQCSTKAAENYAKVAGETADTLAAASFDKCSDEWAKASETLTNYESVDRSRFTDS